MEARYRYRNNKNGDDKFPSHSSQSAILKSGYTVNQTWKALLKAWLGYTIAKNKEEDDSMVYYASVIQKLQKELGHYRISKFSASRSRLQFIRILKLIENFLIRRFVCKIPTNSKQDFSSFV